jgi:tetratricopeptide (TPR) repeat protein
MLFRKPSSPLIGKRYTLLESIGAGNMGTVYRSVDRLTRQTVALKQVKLNPAQIEHGSRGEGDATLTLAQEFKILASLRHPNIISVLDYGFTTDGARASRIGAPVREPYVAMELLENASDMLEYAEKLPLEKQIDLLVQMLQALVYLHRRGVLHRDLKPKNVLVTHGVVKVLDFGLSISAAQSQNGEVAGTPSYMAPEIWNSKPASKGSDLYAVGVIAYRMFAGRHPFDITNMRKLFSEVQSKAPDLSLMNCPEAVRLVVGRLLAKSPAERYPDAAAVITALQAATGQTMTVETVATRESFLQAATFVGRDHELQVLTGELNKAIAGMGGGYLVGGESGVGKSRLLDELRTRALVSGSLVLRGTANAGSQSAYEVWRAILRSLVLFVELSDADASTLKPIVPDIDQLLERKVADPSEISPQAARLRLFRTIDALVRAAARAVAAEGLSIVLMLEDLHWADPESLIMLALLVRTVGELPVFIVGTYRDDETPNLPQSLPGMNVLHLERLTPGQTAELAEAMLGPIGRNRELLTLLQRETEGNTFFLVELVRALAEEAGQLGSVGTAPLPMHVLTSGMASIIQRRLNRITPAARPLILLAAAAGRQLDIDVLQEALRDLNGAERMESWLSAASDAAVLELQDGQWRFAHAKLREGVLSELRPDVFADLNRRVAMAIETVYQYSSKQTAAQLAYHWHIVGDTAKEQQYVALAGEQALRNGAYQAAQRFLRRALDLEQAHNEAQGTEPNKRKLATMKQQLGDAYLGDEQRAAAESLFREALVLFREANYRWGVSTALNRLGNVAGDTGDFERGAQYLIEALQTAYEARALQVAVASLVAMAGLLGRAGMKETALEYVALALHHPSLDVQTGETALRLEESLRAEVPDADAVIARGRGRELKEVISRILEE